MGERQPSYFVTPLLRQYSQSTEALQDQKSIMQRFGTHVIALTDKGTQGVIGRNYVPPLGAVATVRPESVLHEWAKQLAAQDYRP